MEDNILKVKKNDILSVDPRVIIVTDGFNVRQDMGDLEALMTSLIEVGQQVPLKVAKIRGEEKYRLIDGHRRMAAINLALSRGLSFPYVLVTTFTGNEEDEVFSMIVTGTGQKQLTEIEQAEGIKRLVQFGYSVEEIAKKIGKSIPHVYSLTHIANLPKKVKDKIHEGSISATTVLTISKNVSSTDDILKIIDDSVTANKQDGKKTRVTTKNLVGLKVQTPTQKLNEVFQRLLNEGVSNDKVELLDLLLNKTKDLSVDELFETFK